MSRRGGKRRQIVQLDDNKSSKLHRYGYSKELHSGKVELPNLVGAYADSDSEEENVTKDTSDSTVITSDPRETPIQAETEKNDDGMDNELRNFLSEIEAIPMPDNEESSKPVSFGTNSEKTWELNTFQEMKTKEDVHNEEKEEEEIEVDTHSDKRKANAYSMFVKGEVEFVNSPKTENTEKESLQTEQADKEEADIDIPDEPETAWQMVQDETSQYYYYWNTQTNEVTWEIPSEYTQYLLLHREYTERIAKYSPEELKRFKDKKESIFKSSKVNGGDSHKNDVLQATNQFTETSEKVPDENSVSSENPGVLTSQHKPEKKKKSHKHKKHKRRLDRDYSSEEDCRNSPATTEKHKDRPIIGPSLPPVESRLASTDNFVESPISDPMSKSENLDKGSGLLGMGAYLSDQDEEVNETHEKSDSLHLIGPEVNKLFNSNCELSNRGNIDKEKVVLGASIENVIKSDDSQFEVKGSSDNSSSTKIDLQNLHSDLEKNQDLSSESALKNHCDKANLSQSDSSYVTKSINSNFLAGISEKSEPEHSLDKETKKDIEIVKFDKGDKLKKVKEPLDMFEDVPKINDKTQEDFKEEKLFDKKEEELSERLKSNNDSSENIIDNKEKLKKDKKESGTSLSIVASYGTEDEEDGEVKDSDSEKSRKRKKDKKDKRKYEKRRKTDETRSVSDKKETTDKTKKKSENKKEYKEKTKDDKDKVKVKRDKDRSEDKTKDKKNKVYDKDRSSDDKIKSDKSKSDRLIEDKHSVNSKSSEDKSNFKLPEGDTKVSENFEIKISEEKSKVKSNEEIFEPKVDAPIASVPRNKESTDIDFDDLDDLDRALEMALEKKLEEKKIELHNSDPEPEKMNAELPSSVQDHTPKLTNELEEGEMKADEADEEITKTGVKEMADLAISKLEFLDLGTDNLSRLQIVFVELQTRLTDWTAGGLSTEYFLQQLRIAEALLTDYELSAVPDGWACQWDRYATRPLRSYSVIVLTDVA